MLRMVFGVRLDPLEKTAPQEPPVQLDRRDPQDPQDPLDLRDPLDPRELLRHPLLLGVGTTKRGVMTVQHRQISYQS